MTINNCYWFMYLLYFFCYFRAYLTFKFLLSNSFLCYSNNSLMHPCLLSLDFIKKLHWVIDLYQPHLCRNTLWCSWYEEITEWQISQNVCPLLSTVWLYSKAHRPLSFCLISVLVVLNSLFKPGYLRFGLDCFALSHVNCSFFLPLCFLKKIIYPTCPNLFHLSLSMLLFSIFLATCHVHTYKHIQKSLIELCLSKH